MNVETKIEVVSGSHQVTIDVPPDGLTGAETDVINMNGPMIVDFGGSFVDPVYGGFAIPSDARRVPEQLPVKKTFSKEAFTDPAVTAALYRSTMLERIHLALSTLNSVDNGPVGTYSDILVAGKVEQPSGIDNETAEVLDLDLF